MRRLLLPSLIATTLLVTVGAASSLADTVTFNNTALRPDGTVTADTTAPLPTAVIDPVERTPSAAGVKNFTDSVLGGFAGFSMSTGVFIDPGDDTGLIRGGVSALDDICHTTPLQCTGSLRDTLAPGLLNSAPAAALGVNSVTQGENDQKLFVSFSDVTLPPAGEGAQLNEAAADVSAIPEPGTLFLLAAGLVLASRAVRRRPF